MRSVTGTKRQARAENNQIYTLFGSSKIYLELFELGRNLGSLIVGLKPNGVFAPKEYLSPCSSEILGTCVLLELLCDWWYFPPGQTTVLAIHQGLPFFFQAYP